MKPQYKNTTISTTFFESNLAYPRMTWEIITLVMEIVTTN